MQGGVRGVRDGREGLHHPAQPQADDEQARPAPGSRRLDECQVMIRRFDLNGDGVLTFDEFKTMMMMMA